MSVEDMLRELPLRAIVAFAARCAMRVYPLCRRRSQTVVDKIVREVDIHINISTMFAKGTPLSIPPVASISTTTGTATGEGAFAADAAASAAFAAASAVDSEFSNVVAYASHAAVNAFAAAVANLDRKANAAGEAEQAAEEDIQHLMTLNLGRFPELGLPIDPSEYGPLGPLWPRGEPSWFRDRTISGTGFSASDAIVSGTGASVREKLSSGDTQTLSVYVDPGEAPQELIEDLFVALSVFYRSHGGSGLVIVNDEQRIFAAEEAGL